MKIFPRISHSAKKYDNHKVSQVYRRVCSIGEVANLKLIFLLCKKLWYGFFDS